MNPNNIISKQVYDGVALALSKFSDEFPQNTAALRIDATIVVAPNVTVVNGAGAAAVNIQDGGNTISVDVAVLPLPTGAATSANQTNGTQTTNINGTSDITNALSKFRSTTTSDTGEVIDALPGNFYKIRAVNTDLLNIVIKLYDQAVAPTNADTPVMTFTVAAGDGSSFGENYNIPTSFGTGLGIRTVYETADNGTTSPASSPIVEIEFK